MVIQRLQTLYLLLAIVLLAVFAFTTSFTIGGDQGTCYLVGAMQSGPAGNTRPDLLLLTMDGLLVVLGIIAIFTFKNLNLQAKICMMLVALTLAMILCIGVLAVTMKANGTVTLTAWNVLPVAALVLFVLAYRGIKHDKKLLSDSNRLR